MYFIVAAFATTIFGLRLSRNFTCILAAFATSLLPNLPHLRIIFVYFLRTFSFSCQGCAEKCYRSTETILRSFEVITIRWSCNFLLAFPWYCYQKLVPLRSLKKYTSLAIKQKLRLATVAKDEFFAPNEQKQKSYCSSPGERIWRAPLRKRIF